MDQSFIELVVMKLKGSKVHRIGGDINMDQMYIELVFILKWLQVLLDRRIICRKIYKQKYCGWKA